MQMQKPTHQKKQWKKFREESDYIKLPNGDYVDGSFRLSTEDVDEMEAIVDF